MLRDAIGQAAFIIVIAVLFGISVSVVYSTQV